MSNRLVISDQTGKVIASTGKWGFITGINIKAGAGNTRVALYEGQTSAGAPLSIHQVAAGETEDFRELGIAFGATGAYALVDANTEMLILELEVAGPMPTAVLSGG
jgi:hypothetical protein